MGHNIKKTLIFPCPGVGMYHQQHDFGSPWNGVTIYAHSGVETVNLPWNQSIENREKSVMKLETRCWFFWVSNEVNNGRVESMNSTTPEAFFQPNSHSSSIALMGWNGSTIFLQLPSDSVGTSAPPAPAPAPAPWWHKMELGIAKQNTSDLGEFRQNSIPSGYLSHGKSPFSIGKPSINGQFSMAMLNNQRVNCVAIFSRIDLKK